MPPPICQMCEQQDATVHLTQVMDGEVRKLDLCKACAAKSGINVDESMALTNLLLSGDAGPEAEAAVPEKSCPACHMRRGDFKKTSRLGCECCYEAFAEDLGPVLDAYQHSRLHQGKVPPRCRELGAGAGAGRVSLEERLRAAVAAEDFEEAARLRDRLRADAEGPGPSP